MSKKVGRPPKISGADKNFRGRPNFPGSTKFSGADQIFRGRPHFSRGRIWEKIGHFGSSKLSKCTPSNVLVGVQEKPEFELYWGGTGFSTKSDNFREFFVHFCQISKFPENPGWSTPGKLSRPQKSLPCHPECTTP